METRNIQKIYEGKNSTIYYGKYDNYNKYVIIKILNTEYPTEEQINRFNNEYEFTEELIIPGVRKGIKKDKRDGKNTLILEYFDGQTLKDFISSNNCNIKSLVKIASNISQTLGEIHQQNIIHKDINSNNILINEKNEIKIIDFGLATRYTLKTQNLANPQHLEGTLTYISPEQTGRMNRSVDYRSDLYSLGIVLYEMFTKKLPFEDKDNMELIHSHIAKIPIPPNDINNEIPKVLSDIILKLLSKNAEDRYQSAFGLKYDLELMYKNLQASSDLEAFQLGKKDFSG
jgi:serine/threonine protein kinase